MFWLIHEANLLIIMTILQINLYNRMRQINKINYYFNFVKIIVDFIYFYVNMIELELNNEQ